ncbi:hypothetical protein NMY22_g6605 [Coprinellus aureogranulatus]|nr:hypothetical protein NMY22_g6605 [Coprinellus aureogranulatus]
MTAQSALPLLDCAAFRLEYDQSTSERKWRTLQKVCQGAHVSPASSLPLQEELTTSERRQRLDALRQQIHSLEAQLAQLKDEEKRQGYELEQIALSSTPITRISDDILREVFLQTLPTPQEQVLSTYPKRFRIWESPLLLRRVCRHWKNLAENHSQLWSTLRLYIPDKAPQGTKSNRTMLKRWAAAWLRLTKGSRLQLDFICHTDESNLIAHALPPPAYNRLTKLSIAGDHLTYHALAKWASKVSYAAFPVLEDLVIGRCDPFPGHAIEPIKVFENCPRLRRAIVGRMSHADSDIPLIPLPWQQLTHFAVLSPVTLQFYHNLMSECPVLRFSVIVPHYIEGHEEQPSSPDTIWHWPNLSSLTLSFWDSNHGDFFFPIHFHYLPLEQLRSLRLVAPEFALDVDEDPLFLDSVESMKELRHLSLCFSAIGLESYLDTFQYLPQLTSLDIQLRNLWEPDDDPLKILAENTSLLPNLTTMTIDIGAGWGQSFSMGNLATFIDRRARSPGGDGKLQQLAIYIPIDLGRVKDTLTMEGLQELAKRGSSSGVEVHIRNVAEERLNLEDISHWVDRDEELVNNWPEARNAFVTRDIEHTFFSDSSDED